jgi:hypothetical protein
LPQLPIHWDLRNKVGVVGRRLFRLGGGISLWKEKNFTTLLE